jgi:hypothetical protein
MNRLIGIALFVIPYVFVELQFISEVSCLNVLKLHRSGSGNSVLSMSDSKKRALLDSSTLWRVNLKLQKDGYNDVNAPLRIRFIEERGYEPPSGKIFIEDDINGIVKTDKDGYAGIWMLSEDKDDRKDGLWIWGLFQEPKYPFLYFNFDVYNNTVLPSGEEEPIFGGLGIPNGRLYMRMRHERDKEKGSVLYEGQLSYKVTEIVNADFLGIVKFDAGQFVDGGAVEVRHSSFHISCTLSYCQSHDRSS